MPNYLYEALDTLGAAVMDQVEAADEGEAQERLRARGYSAMRLQIVGGDSPQDESDVEPGEVLRPEVSAKVAGDAARGREWKAPRWLWAVWSLMFLGIGGVFLYMLGVRPVLAVMRASGWVEMPCTVVSSRLKEDNSDEDGPTYSIEIVYQYECGGRAYQADRYDFLSLSSNTNVDARRAVVEANPPGRRTVCYVDPANPAEAVLERRWTSEMLWGLFPIPFVLVGVCGLLFGALGLRFKQQKPATFPDETPPAGS
jgi:hypothetical protein